MHFCCHLLLIVPIVASRQRLQHEIAQIPARVDRHQRRARRRRRVRDGRLDVPQPGVYPRRRERVRERRDESLVTVGLAPVHDDRGGQARIDDEQAHGEEAVAAGEVHDAAMAAARRRP